MTGHLFTVLKPMEVVPAHVQTWSFLAEAVIHVPVSGRDGCDHKLRMTRQAQYHDFLLMIVTSEKIGFYNKLVKLIICNTATLQGYHW